MPKPPKPEINLLKIREEVVQQFKGLIKEEINQFKSVYQSKLEQQSQMIERARQESFAKVSYQSSLHAINKNHNEDHQRKKISQQEMPGFKIQVVDES